MIGWIVQDVATDGQTDRQDRPNVVLVVENVVPWKFYPGSRALLIELSIDYIVASHQLASRIFLGILLFFLIPSSLNLNIG